MLRSIAIENYRSIISLKAELNFVNVITGANGTGKSNLYKSLKLLTDIAKGNIINSIANQGGLNSCFWAGPEKISRRMEREEVLIQGTKSKNKKQLKLGFSSDEFSYSMTLGLPPASKMTFFKLDPEIKEEFIWLGDTYRRASLLTERKSTILKVRDNKKWRTIDTNLEATKSILNHMNKLGTSPEILAIRDNILDWRFYDSFRTDESAPSRSVKIGSEALILNSNGSNLASALQTILERDKAEDLHQSIEDAFPGSTLSIEPLEGNRLSVNLKQKGLLRSLSSEELSDGTLKYLLLVAALLSPLPPKLMILNEPENSLNPNLLGALAKLILKASNKSQIIVASNSTELVNYLVGKDSVNLIELKKDLGRTQIEGQTMTNQPPWHWPS